ncbi:MAG: cysteine desulfurase [Candidatus Nomurabacteria bacterium]|jgi:cysteine desulfurase|nr:cysteine desulfurase [Candidatus Nomurabacteria bacterium]
MTDFIYLDHAAATPMSERVLKAMQPFFSERFFNPSSPYLPAVEVKRSYEAAKDALARTIGAKGSDLVMTAGATESINLAFTAAQGKVLVSAVEHQSVLEAAKKTGDFELIPVNRHGMVDLSALQVPYLQKVGLVSVALVNNELGTIQPISDIAVLVSAERRRRLQAGDKRPIYLHCDASQGFGLLDVNVARLGVDMLTLNAGKIYGPKQVGLLWVRPGVRLQPVVVGGGQELGLRSGTENVAGAVGFAAAAMDAKKHAGSELKRLAVLKKLMSSKLETGISDVMFLGSSKKQLASFLPITVPGVDAERLVFTLENDGILLSTGAACAANKGARSHVLEAIGLSDEEASGSLRISLGKLNNEANVAAAADKIIAVIKAEKARIKGLMK